MKLGCALLLVTWIAVGVTHYFLLQDTEWAEKWWVPILLGLSAAQVVGSLQAIILALRQVRALGRNPSQWRDGELVATSGKIQPVADSAVLPFSGERALIAEYEIRYTSRSSETTTVTTAIQGMAMVGCTVKSFRLVGFPLLNAVPEKTFNNQAAFERAADYLATSKFQPRAKGIKGALNELQSILNDDDGSLKANFSNGAHLSRLLDHSDDDGTPIEGTSLGKQQIVELLVSGGYTLMEKAIAPGTEVTVFGKFDRNKRTINVGSGLSEMSNGLALGNAGAVTFRKIRNTALQLIVWGGVCVAAHWYVFRGF